MVFLEDEEFVTKTINGSTIDLETIPVSKVRQLAKNMEAPKATAHHIKQVTGDPQDSPNQFDETSTHRPPTKQAQGETMFQVKTIQSQAVCK